MKFYSYHIELKLRRTNGESINAYKNKIRKDFCKLKRIKRMLDSRGETNVKYWLIALDKTNDISYTCPQNIERIKVRYVFADCQY